MQVPHNSVILVADGRKSLFFRNQGDADFPNLSVVEKDGRKDAAHHEISSDLAGHASNTLGSSMEEADFHQLDEDRFAAETAAMLKERALRNEFDTLVVVARRGRWASFANIIMSRSRSVWSRRFPRTSSTCRCRRSRGSCSTPELGFGAQKRPRR